ncbi:MAG: response regulator transcription factor, partial [Clostridiales Family XIII bacterium]|nr:response regulator transcription factor [Clostridiales Family XIII bacterium]
MGSRVYIVEDDDNIRELVLYALDSYGFVGRGFTGADTFFPSLRDEPPDLILLDVMLPGEDGISILGRLKSGEHAGIPVIMLTAKGSEFDRIKGLDSGADDYVTKPFSVMEVLSRIRAVLRRCVQQDDKGTALHVSGVTLEGEKRRVTFEGVEVALTFKEFELLHCLLQNEGVVLSRDTIL